MRADEGASPRKSASVSKAVSAKARITSLLPVQRRSSSLGASAASSVTSERAARHWDLVRMHFLDYPRTAHAVTRAKWTELIEAALEEARAQRHRRRAAELLLRTGLFSGAMSPPASRTPSLGPWQPAGWDTLAAAAATAAAEPATPLGQALLPESRAPSGQPLASPSGSSTAASSCASSSAGLSWQPAIPRTVSRRQLFALQPAQPHLPGLRESPEANAVQEQQKGEAHKISDEWVAYEQHVAQKLNQDMLRDSLEAAHQRPAIHA